MKQTHQRNRQNKRFLRHLDDFDKLVVIGQSASGSQCVEIGKGQAASKSNVEKIVEKVLPNTTLWIFNLRKEGSTTRFTRDIGIKVVTAENGTQNANIATLSSLITHRTNLAVRSMNSSSGQEIPRVITIFEQEKQRGVNTLSATAIARVDTFHEFILTDETRGYKNEEASELPVQRAHLHFLTGYHTLITW